MTSAAAETPPSSEEPNQDAVSQLGLCLDAAEVFVSGWECSAASETPELEATRLDHWNTSPLPPSVLVPRIDGEPVRADLSWPPHPRGIGQLRAPGNENEGDGD